MLQFFLSRHEKSQEANTYSLSIIDPIYIHTKVGLLNGVLIIECSDDFHLDPGVRHGKIAVFGQRTGECVERQHFHTESFVLDRPDDRYAERVQRNTSSLKSSFALAASGAMLGIPAFSVPASEEQEWSSNLELNLQDLRHETQPGNAPKVVVESHQHGTGFQGMGSDPKIIDR